MTFKREVTKLFINSISGQKDTLWYSTTETLLDAVIRIYDDYEMSDRQDIIGKR